jgi:hypothetical protein
VAFDLAAFDYRNRSVDRLWIAKSNPVRLPALEQVIDVTNYPNG